MRPTVERTLQMRLRDRVSASLLHVTYAHLGPFWCTQCQSTRIYNVLRLVFRN